jgi:Fe-S oxidoreductase
VLDALDQIDPAREAPIVGLEPPEIYSLKHDYVDLLPEREEEITRRTARVWLLDEFLLRADEFDALRVATLGQSSNLAHSPSKKIKFHPHCHQRAEGPASDGLPNGTGATVELLRACGFDVELLDTGCCGMAGTFGYEAEHYELSMKVGELKLFPALAPTAPTPSERGTSPKSGMESSQVNQSSTVGFGGLRSVPEGQREGVISTGAACRMQIRQGTGINALHPVMLIADFIKGHTDQKDLQGPHHPAQSRARGV